jgi:thiol-disulfide isomerase/thioredoxin
MNKFVLFAGIFVIVAVSLWIVLTYVKRDTKKETFAEEKNKPKVVIVHASWCKYCVEYLSGTTHNGKSTFDAAAEKVGNKVDFEKLDFDENKELANKYGASSFPTIIGVSSSGDVKQFDGDRDDLNAVVSFANSLS